MRSRTTPFDLIEDLREATPGSKFLGIPDAWYVSELYRCLKGHVSKTILKSDLKGDLCLACYEAVRLTFPDDREGHIPLLLRWLDTRTKFRDFPVPLEALKALLGAVDPLVRLPAIGTTFENSIQVSWSFQDVGATFTLDLLEDGRIEWFFRAPKGYTLGSDEPVDRLPPGALDLLEFYFVDRGLTTPTSFDTSNM